MDDTQEMTQESKKGLSPVLIIGILLLIVIGGGIVVFANTNKKEAMPVAGMQQQASTPTQSSMKQEETNAPVATDAQVITVEGGNFFFKPNEIKVKKGEKVTITFNNSGGMHNFVIDALNVKTDVIEGGKTETVSFTPDKAGTFEFYCSVGKHREMGMKGNLIVE